MCIKYAWKIIISHQKVGYTDIFLRPRGPIDTARYLQPFNKIVHNCSKMRSFKMFESLKHTIEEFVENVKSSL